MQSVRKRNKAKFEIPVSLNILGYSEPADTKICDFNSSSSSSSSSECDEVDNDLKVLKLKDHLNKKR